MHLCAELIAASMTLESLGEVGANFSLQFSSRTHFSKINNTVSPKISVKNIKIEFSIYAIMSSPGLLSGRRIKNTHQNKPACVTWNSL